MISIMLTKIFNKSFDWIITMKIELIKTQYKGG
jgi:hypothetical protein